MPRGDPDELVTCKGCRGDVGELSLTVFGEGNKAGIKGDVNSLKETRANVRWGFGLLWSGVIAIGAAIVKVWWSK